MKVHLIHYLILILVISISMPKAQDIKKSHDNPDVMFDIGIASYSFKQSPLEELIITATKLNINKLAIKSFHLPLDASDQQIEHFKSKVKDAELNAYAASVVYMKSTEEVDNAFEYAKKAGFEMIVSVPNPELLEYTEEKVKAYDIKLAIHLHGPGDLVYPTAQSIYDLIKDRDKRIGICMDLGHILRQNLDPVQQIRIYADRLMDIHIWDCASATSEARSIITGYGVLDFKAVFKTLIEIQYQGTLSMEYNADFDDPGLMTGHLLGYMEGILSTIEPRAEKIHNHLTEEEIQEGWELLFDGKTTEKWRGINSVQFPKHGWVIRDGQLCIEASGGGESQVGGAIITKEQYDDFELYWEWKMITSGGNSGIKYFVQEGLADNPKHGIGLEYQILDDANHPWMLEGKMKPGDYHTTGSLYELYPATNKKLFPNGTYNKGRIISQGSHVEHWLNGIKILEYERSSKDFRSKVMASKFKMYQNFGESPKGHILIQDHGSKVCYRNIKIRRLKNDK